MEEDGLDIAFPDHKSVSGWYDLVFQVLERARGPKYRKRKNRYRTVKRIFQAIQVVHVNYIDISNDFEGRIIPISKNGFYETDKEAYKKDEGYQKRKVDALEALEQSRSKITVDRNALRSEIVAYFDLADDIVERRFLASAFAYFVHYGEDGFSVFDDEALDEYVSGRLSRVGAQFGYSRSMGFITQLQWAITPSDIKALVHANIADTNSRYIAVNRCFLQLQEAWDMYE
jgi:hypothetical protein